MEEENVASMFDGPQPYNFEPRRRERGQGSRERDTSRGRNDGQRREVELWALGNQWRIGQTSW